MLDNAEGSPESDRMDNPGTCPASASIAFAAGLASSFCAPTLLTFPTVELIFLPEP